MFKDGAGGKFKSHMVAKMFLTNGGIAVAATENKQSSEIGIRQTKGAGIPATPILDRCTALRAAHSGTVRIVKIPIPQKFIKSVQRLCGMRGLCGVCGSCCVEGSRLLFNMFPEGAGDLNSHAAAFSIREKQGGREFCH
jgi:hypothetical protein